MGQAGLLDLIQPGLHEAQADLVVDARGVGRQVGAFGDNVDACKQRDGLIRPQVHDVAFALGADQFQGQETADGLKRAAVTTACRSMRSSKGTNRNSPAKGVRKELGDKFKRRTSATSAISGFTVTGRSSSARRGRRAKPSSRSKTVRELMLMVWPAAASSRCMSYTERLRLRMATAKSRTRSRVGED